MEHFHPRLRKELLKDKEHRKRGLTAQGLRGYEALVAQLYYLVHYSSPDVDFAGSEKDKLPPDSAGAEKGEQSPGTKAGEGGKQSPGKNGISSQGNDDPAGDENGNSHEDDDNPTGQAADPEILIDAISDFRAMYMPRFDDIHKKWVARQKRAINSSHYDLGPEFLDKIWQWLSQFGKKKEQDRVMHSSDG